MLNVVILCTFISKSIRKDEATTLRGKPLHGL